MKGDEVKIQQRCHVSFSIGDDYNDKVWCDVVPIDGITNTDMKHIKHIQ